MHWVRSVPRALGQCGHHLPPSHQPPLLYQKIYPRTIYNTFFPKKFFPTKVSVHGRSPPIWSLFLSFPSPYPYPVPPSEFTTSSISTSLLSGSNIYHDLVQTMRFTIRKSWTWILDPPLTSCVQLGFKVIIENKCNNGLTTWNYYKDHKRQWGKKLRTVPGTWESPQ